MADLSSLYQPGGSLANFLQTQGIDQTMWQGYSPQEQQGIISSMAGLGTLDQTDTGFLGGINETLGTNMTGGDLLKGAMGIGQLGLGVASFLDQKKTAKKQRGLMDQQISQNKFLLDQARGRQADIGKAFGGGLAASSV